VLRAMLIGGLLGVLVAELVASLMEWRFPPSLPAHVAALAFGLACGYGAGLTVLLDELLVGALDTVKWLGGEAQWRGVVNKMIKVFGAPVGDEDARVIVEYLSREYGAGR